MQEEQFGSLLRHLLANLHDYAVLEKHPLNEVFPRPDASITRAEYLRRTVAAAIETLKPQHLRFDVSATEWRYYLILYGRYIEGANLSELQDQLALGDRQERRIHMRALDLLQSVLYEQAEAATLHKPSQLSQPPSGSAESAAANSALQVSLEEDQDTETNEIDGFQIVLEPLQLRRVLDEVIDLCESHICASRAEILVEIPGDLPGVLADRIILRQILLHLVNTVLLSWQAAPKQAAPLEPVVIAARQQAGAVALVFQWRPRGDQHSLPQLAEQAPLRYWLEQLHMQLDFDVGAAASPATSAGFVRLALLLPAADQATLLVVDDHESAIRLIQRFLQSTAIRVIGETDPSRVPELVRSLRPQVLLLDVMMPGTDGWELLQRLKADPETNGIPAVVYSVWGVRELALSLGASDFLKKPIARDHLLAVLRRLLPIGALPAVAPKVDEQDRRQA